MMSDRFSLNWEKIHKETTIVDLHVHPSLKVALFNRKLSRRYSASRSFNPFSVRTDFPKLKDGSVKVLCSTVYAPEHEIYHECRNVKILKYLMPFRWKKIFKSSYFEVTNAMLDQMEQQVEESMDPVTGKPIAKMVYSVKELNDLLSSGPDRPIGIIHNIEGAHSLDNQIEHLQHYFNRGVAYLSLAHFYPNGVANPCFPFPESLQRLGFFLGDRDVSQGLTPFGEQVVEKMIEMGMIIDVTHCTPPARARIYDMVGNRMPIIASHVGVYEINPSPYNLKDWEIKKIADSGGVVAVIFMNYWLMPRESRRGINFIVRTLDHIIKVGGSEQAAIGTDFDGFIDPPDDLKDSSLLYKLTQRLIAEGYSEALIKKIWGENALRVIRQGWGKKQ